jgi:hypothetical protein
LQEIPLPVDKKFFSPLAVIGVVLYFFWYFWVGYIRFYSSATIKLERRNEKRSFWKRNSDQIIVAFIGAFIGAAIAVAVQKFFIG